MVSNSPFGEFIPHPKTPIAISPELARMGGNIAKTSNRLIRFGQNNSRNMESPSCFRNHQAIA